MYFSNVWAHAQALRSDVLGSFVLKAWRRLFRSAAQSDEPITSASDC
jgi:hypothetical protein